MIDERLNSGSSITIRDNNVSYYSQRLDHPVPDLYNEYADQVGLHQSKMIFTESEA